MSLINPAILVEQYTRSSSVAKITLLPRETKAFNVYGRSFYLKECTGVVGVTSGDIAEKLYKKGQGEDYPDELRFNRLELRNPSVDSPITLEIWAGFGKFIDSRFEIIEAFTKITAGKVVGNTIANNAEVDFDGIPPDGDSIQRKAIVVSNLDANGNLIIVDENDNFCCAVFPKTSITLPIAGFVGVRNVSGAAIACYVSEIWYAQNLG